MIIICPCGEKKFEVDENLIPHNGRLLKCGSCDQTWFFNKKEEINYKSVDTNKYHKKENLDTREIETNKKKVNISSGSNNKGSELIKYSSKPNFTVTIFFRYLLAIIISFTALILVVHTFKIPLSVFFPNLELILYNLFESIRDLILFIKDLN